MGQKVSPHGLRVGVIKDWDSRWTAPKRHFGDLLVEDHKIREYLFSKTYKTDKSPVPRKPGISKVEIEREATKIKVFIHTSKPGVLIGAKGAEISIIKKDIERITAGKPVDVNIIEVKQVDLDAKLVAENIAEALENRMPFRRAMKTVIQRTMRSGAYGIKTMVSGRLGGAEIARSESYKEGTIPLHTFRADIDYGIARANTTYGVIGVKVWIYKGEILKGEIHEKRKEEQNNRTSRGGKDSKRSDNRRGGGRSRDAQRNDRKTSDRPARKDFQNRTPRTSNDKSGGNF